jgi:hypothetical protein
MKRGRKQARVGGESGVSIPGRCKGPEGGWGRQGSWAKPFPFPWKDFDAEKWEPVLGSKKSSDIHWSAL